MTISSYTLNVRGIIKSGFRRFQNFKESYNHICAAAWQNQQNRASINVQNQEVQDLENETWSRKVTQNLQFSFDLRRSKAS